MNYLKSMVSNELVSIVMKPEKHGRNQLMCWWGKIFVTGCFAKRVFGAFETF